MAAVSQKVLAAGLLTLQDLTRPPKKGEASFSGLPYAKQWMARKDIERFISSVCERVVVKEVFGNLSLDDAELSFVSLQRTLGWCSIFDGWNVDGPAYRRPPLNLSVSALDCR